MGFLGSELAAAQVYRACVRNVSCYAAYESHILEESVLRPVTAASG